MLWWWILWRLFSCPDVHTTAETPRKKIVQKKCPKFVTRFWKIVPSNGKFHQLFRVPLTLSTDTRTPNTNPTQLLKIIVWSCNLSGGSELTLPAWAPWRLKAPHTACTNRRQTSKTKLCPKFVQAELGGYKTDSCSGEGVVAKFQSDKSAPGLPRNFMTYGFLDPFAERQYPFNFWGITTLQGTPDIRGLAFALFCTKLRVFALFCAHLRGNFRYFPLTLVVQNRESECDCRIAGLEFPQLPQREAQSESNRNGCTVESRKVDSESLIQTATYPFSMGRNTESTEAHNSNTNKHKQTQTNTNKHKQAQTNTNKPPPPNKKKTWQLETWQDSSPFFLRLQFGNFLHILGQLLFRSTQKTSRKRENIYCPVLPLLVFCAIPCFFPLQGFPCFFFFERFSLLFQGFEGFGRDKQSLFFVWFSLPFSKTQRKDRVEKIKKMALTPPGGHAWVKNLKKSPNFTVRNAPNRHPPRRWVLFMSWHFVFFCFFVLFSPWFFISPSISWDLSEAFYADAVRRINPLTLAFALYFPAFERWRSTRSLA